MYLRCYIHVTLHHPIHTWINVYISWRFHSPQTCVIQKYVYRFVRVRAIPIASGGHRLSSDTDRFIFTFQRYQSLIFSSDINRFNLSSISIAAISIALFIRAMSIAECFLSDFNRYCMMIYSQLLMLECCSSLRVLHPPCASAESQAWPRWRTTSTQSRLSHSKSSTRSRMAM